MSDQEFERALTILLVEDSPTDALLVEEALAEALIVHQMHRVEDGVAALEFLRQEKEYDQAPRPDLILLDLNLPKKNGLEVLEIIKTDDALKAIPVIVLTTSKAEEDIVKSYNLYANCYVIKPLGFDKFTEAVQAIREFWARIVTMPPPARSKNE